jgi:hypothetical protein
LRGIVPSGCRLLQRWSVVRAVNSLQESLGAPVPSYSSNERNALIAETAFLLAGAGFPNDLYEKYELEAKARDFLLKLPHSSGAEAELTSEEWLEVGMLAQITRRYAARLHQPIFSPSIPGCGVVDAATADLLAGRELVEIKTVTRPFRSYDVRQALTYTAMLYSSGYTVEIITLLNPRRARVVNMPVGEIAAVTRGDSAVELMQDLMEWMLDLQVSA